MGRPDLPLECLTDCCPGDSDLSAAVPPERLRLSAGDPVVPGRRLLHDRRFRRRWLSYFAPWAIVWALLIFSHYQRVDRDAQSELAADSRAQVTSGIAVLSAPLDRA